MTLVFTPDIPGFNVYGGDCTQYASIRLNLYLGESLSWSAFVHGGTSKIIQVYHLPKGPYTNYPISVACTHTFTIPGCWRIGFPLLDYFHGVYINNKWIWFLIYVANESPPPVVTPVWNLQIGPL